MSWRNDQIGVGVSRCPIDVDCCGWDGPLSLDEQAEISKRFTTAHTGCPPYNPDRSLIGYIEQGQGRSSPRLTDWLNFLRGRR